jgi:hypothetical protein
MKFDSNLAWKHATSAVAANREVLLALAGVFFLLPNLAFSLLFERPEPTSPMSPEQMMAMMSDYYVSAAPFLIVIFLFQAAGTLALLTLLTDRSRPTVAEALRHAIGGILSYALAQILLGLGLGLLAGLTLMLAGFTGLQLLVGIAFVGMVALGIYAFIRFSLVAPVIAAEGDRNPVSALQRSWRLTAGNSPRIAVFYFLFFFAFMLVIIIVMAVLGGLLAVIAGAEAGRITAAVVSTALSTMMMLYFVAILAAAHRQLAGPSPEAVRAPFE